MLRVLGSKPVDSSSINQFVCTHLCGCGKERRFHLPPVLNAHVGRIERCIPDIFFFVKGTVLQVLWLNLEIRPNFKVLFLLGSFEETK